LVADVTRNSLVAWRLTQICA